MYVVVVAAAVVLEEGVNYSTFWRMEQDMRSNVQLIPFRHVHIQFLHKKTAHAVQAVN